MAWQRKIPFGYQMRGGAIEAHPQEAGAVQAIFTQYLAGDSYLKIAETMTKRGIPYHPHTPVWNKNMVKRILENEKYLGEGPYQALISRKDFLDARTLCTDKNTYRPCAREVQPVREKLVCGLCGARMARDTKSHGYQRWRCQGPECGQTVRMEDKMLCKKVEQELQKLAQMPALLTAPPTASATLSTDAKRIQNELILALNRGTESPEYIKSLAFAAAAERYTALPDPMPAHRLNRLRERLEQGPADADVWNDLLETAVHFIRLSPDHKVELELVNGKILKSEEVSSHE